MGNLLSNKGFECTNCGRPLQGEEHFCPECGQQNDTRKVSVKEMFLHFLGGFFAFDNLFFRTLKPLILKPGLVSKEYIDGKRKKYTNPFIFLLHSAILFFIVTNLIDSLKSDRENELLAEKMNYLIEKNIDSLFSMPQNAMMLQDTSVTKIEKEQFFQHIYNSNKKIQEYYKNKHQLSDELFTINNQDNLLNYAYISKKLKENHLDFDIDISGNDSISIIPKEQYNPLKRKSKVGKFSNFSSSYTDLPTLIALDSLKEKPTYWNIFLYERARKFNQFTSSFGKNFEEVAGQIYGMIPMALFIVLPLFTLVFSLLYIRHRYTYTEHLIVVFNIQSVLFWLILFSSIVSIPFNEKTTETVTNLFFLYYLYYVYKTLRKFYGQRRFKTLIKFGFISFSYGIFAVLGGFILLSIVVMR